MSEACCKLIRGWINNRIQQHASCPYESGLPLPTRVIDVGRPGESSEPALLVTDGQCGDWVALSHCWGKGQAFKTKTNNLEGLRRAMLLNILPATIRDAISITKWLGYQYLWVDSLCIIQDSPGGLGRGVGPHELRATQGNSGQPRMDFTGK